MYNVTDTGVLKTVESWCVTIPLHDNDKQPFDESTVDSILQDILLNYPGFSIANSMGYWKGSDRTYVDKNYQIMIDAVPDQLEESSNFFATLKQDLQTRLRQEKIYITKQDSKQEFLTFQEFFDDVGVHAHSHDLRQEAAELAKKLAGSLDFVLQRLGYETTALRRDHEQKKIIWERKLCGIKIRSEFDDSYPDVNIIAADQFLNIGNAILSGKPFVLIGTYEFQFYILEKKRRRSLVKVNETIINSAKYTKYFSPIEEPLSTTEFIEDFTMSVFVNWLILRDEGFLPNEIKISVGGDGSLQIGLSDIGRIMLHCPAAIPEKIVQTEIIRCLSIAINHSETNTIDPIAVLQAKANNNYILKRAFVRSLLRKIHDQKKEI
ncbi:MAG: hypothetical protein HZB61_01720 [Nitrospirae bacterium]|nr:hypothetical protein [Nitrospirota bacterium]